MKQAYYIDFPLVIYVTRIVEAESIDEAREIAKKLCENNRFFDEHIIESLYNDDAGGVDYLSENLEDPEVIPYGGERWGGIDKEYEDRYMDAEELEKYIDLEA